MFAARSGPARSSHGARDICSMAVKLGRQLPDAFLVVCSSINQSMVMGEAAAARVHVARALLCSCSSWAWKIARAGGAGRPQTCALGVSAAEAQHFAPRIIQDGTLGGEGRLGWRACMAPFLGLEKRFSRESPTPTTTRSATSARIGTNWSANWFRNTSLRAHAESCVRGQQKSLEEPTGPGTASSGEGTNWSAKCSGTPAFATRPAYVRGGGMRQQVS